MRNGRVRTYGVVGLVLAGIGLGLWYSWFRSPGDASGPPILSISAHGVAQQTLAIGLADGPEEYLFGQIADVATGPDGEIVVVDYQAHSVRVFDRDGRFVRHVGAEGDGPGEYRFPLRAAITDDGIIGICHRRGVTLFEQDGVLADFAISIPGGWCRLSSASSGGMIISKEPRCNYVGFRCGWHSEWWTYLLSASGAVTDSFPTPAPRLTINLETLDFPSLPYLISRWRPDGSRIHIWTADPEIEIDHAPRDPGGGGAASQLHLDLERVPIRPEERRVFVDMLQRRIDRAPLWSGIADELMPRDMPAIPLLTVGVDGLLWIHSQMPSGSLSEGERVADTPPGNGVDGWSPGDGWSGVWYWYVVDVDEMTLRSFELPFPILAIQEAAGDTIWASYLSNDVPMLGRFEIRW